MTLTKVLGRHRWEFALIGISAVWGSTFVLVKDAVERIPPFQYLALRFACATAALAIFGAFRGLRRTEATAGVAIGIALFGGYALQTVGLQYTSASNAGFITGLFVVITPLLGAVILRRLPSKASAAGVILATAGLVLLAMPSGMRLGGGDALEVLCAISFAVHILLLARLAPGRSALRIAGVQIATTAAASAIWSIGAERAPLPGADGTVWFAIAATGLLASALGFVVQTRAQQIIPPTRTAVILTAEPVFAGIFGFLIAGDRLGVRGYAGAALIVLGILVAETLAPPTEEI
ncbi:MAG: DMT family transporter [Actinomycetota bacterium]